MNHNTKPTAAHSAASRRRSAVSCWRKLETKTAINRARWVSLLIIALLAAFPNCTELEEELTPENTPEETKSYGSISIVSNPPGAAIWLDGDSTGKVTDATLENVSIGTHGIRLSLFGWADVYDTVGVKLNQQVEFSKTLDIVYGGLQVNSTPPGADVYIDGVATGEKTDCLLERIQIGKHTVKYVIDGFRGANWEWTGSVEITKDETAMIFHSFPCGHIQVDSDPSGAEIWIDGENTGTSTNCLIEYVTSGMYRVELIREDYYIWEEDVVVNDGIISQVTANLTKGLDWKFKTDDEVFSTPGIGTDGTIYFGSEDHHLYALNSNGSLKWRYGVYDEIESSPAIGIDGTIYFGSGESESKYCSIYAILPNGSKRWNYEIGGYYDGVMSSPAIGSEGTVYVGSWDHYLYAVNPDGSLKWRYKTEDNICSSPAIGFDGTIYVGSYDSYLYAINSDGSLKWKYKTGDEVRSSPAIASDGTVYVGSIDDFLYAITPDGSLKWRYQTESGVFSSPTIGSDGTVYVGSWDGNLYAISPNGDLDWRYETSDWGISIASSPTIGSDGVIYVGSGGYFSDYGYLYAINPDGTLNWRYRIDDDVSSSPTIGSDGTVYVGADDGYLYAITSSSNGLANSAWPKFHHDNKNTGRAGAPIGN